MAGEQLAEGMTRYRKRYRAANRKERTAILDEFCSATEYHRKYAITLLRKPADEPNPQPRRRRGVTYTAATVRVLEAIWKAADYPWSKRLKALLPLWLPRARKHVHGCTPEVEAQLLRMSPRQMDRRLAEKRRKLKRRLYGRTKPGTLLKHHIPIKTDNWDVHEPGFCEIDLVSHSGPNASGEFIHSLNVTDIHTGWCETRAIMGKGEAGVVLAIDDIRRCLPFQLKAIDSDNGSEFINDHLLEYCKKRGIQFTRGRPYKKDDNAHIEQKNWTHVRRILGWDRYDTPEQLKAINTLYKGELPIMMNLFQPCVKLIGKERIGSRLRRYYDQATTPLDRLVNTGMENPALTRMVSLRESTDPFELAKSIETQLKALEKNRRKSKRSAA